MRPRTEQEGGSQDPTPQRQAGLLVGGGRVAETAARGAKQGHAVCRGQGAEWMPAEDCWGLLSPPLICAHLPGTTSFRLGWASLSPALGWGLGPPENEVAFLPCPLLPPCVLPSAPALCVGPWVTVPAPLHGKPCQPPAEAQEGPPFRSCLWTVSGRQDWPRGRGWSLACRTTGGPRMHLLWPEPLHPSSPSKLGTSAVPL